mmetsp:Transcript_3735/g.503  ORF Transcript_3735/g.503 Transcript_3735/m.503 type:complete len:81 (-) Transcript_3735:2556-2798(-)
MQEIQLDLTFDYKVRNQYHAGLAARDLIREIINLYPPLQNLVLVIKTFLSCSYLNSPYYGGLSSYSLVIWTVAYLNALEK